MNPMPMPSVVGSKTTAPIAPGRAKIATHFQGATLIDASSGFMHMLGGTSTRSLTGNVGRQSYASEIVLENNAGVS